MNTVMGPHLVVVEPGPLALIQDEGRRGHLAVGVGRAGAADLAAFALGNRIAGNRLARRRGGSGAIEVTFGGLVVRAVGNLTLCLTGAPAPATVNGRPVAHASSFRVRDGEEVRLGTPSAGMRTYLCVRGGIDVPFELGSRSSDTMSGLGPAPLKPGDVLPVGGNAKRWVPVDHAPVRPLTNDTVTLAVTPGPRYPWFAEPDQLTQIEWSTSEKSDRKGVRLNGGSLARAAEFRDAELASEGMVRGAVQVPPNGEPVVFLSDFPVTGGYPVIGVVRAKDVDLVAQLRPGQPVRFRWEGRSTRRG